MSCSGTSLGGLQIFLSCSICLTWISSCTACPPKANMIVPTDTTRRSKVSKSGSKDNLQLSHFQVDVGPEIFEMVSAMSAHCCSAKNTQNTSCSTVWRQIALSADLISPLVSFSKVLTDTVCQHQNLWCLPRAFIIPKVLSVVDPSRMECATWPLF